MRISDWSSDVCSSDLRPANLGPTPFHRLPRPTHRREETDLAGRTFAGGLQLLGGDQAPTAPAPPRVRCALYQTCTPEAPVPWHSIPARPMPASPAPHRHSPIDRKSTRLNSTH